MSQVLSREHHRNLENAAAKARSEAGRLARLDAHEQQPRQQLRERDSEVGDPRESASGFDGVRYRTDRLALPT